MASQTEIKHKGLTTTMIMLYFSPSTVHTRKL
jgi:hypothetical protein